MAKGEEITTKFKVDISDLKKGITEANKQIKLANAEFKAASSGMDDWSKSSEGINAKLKQLQTVLSSQVSKLENYKKQLQEVEKAKQENGKRADELRKKLQELSSQGVSKTSDEYKKYQKALTDVEKEQIANQKASDDLRITILNQQGAINGTSKDMRHLEDSLRELENGSTKAEDEVDDLSKSLRDTEDASKKASDGFTVMKGALANLVADGIRKAIDATKEFAKEMIGTAAEVKAENSQFEQTFGDLADSAESAIKRVADSTGILDSRLKIAGSQIYAFARSNGATIPEAMELMENALLASADSAAYYDKSLEESTETLKSFLKGNYANDAALGVSATEFTRNAKATELFGKKYNDLTEIQKQQTLLKMVTDSQKLSGAMGQAAREADGWENVQGNLNETWRQFQAQVGTPFLEALIPVIQRVTDNFTKWRNSFDWEKFGQDVERNLEKVEKGFNWIIRNQASVINAMKLIMATFAVAKVNSFTTELSGMATKLIGMATNVGQAKNALSLFTGVSKTATIAQNGLNVATNAGAIASNLFANAWKANPIGLIITGLTIATPLILDFVEKMKDAKEITDEDYTSTQELMKAHQALNDEIKDGVETRKEALENAGQEVANADIMLKKLEELSAVEDKSNSQKETMQYLVSQLNTMIPDLNLKYDAEKDALNKSTEAIRLNIEATKEMTKAKFAQEQLTEIAGEMVKVEMEQQKLTEKRLELENSYNKASQERMDFQQKYGEGEIFLNDALYQQYSELLETERAKKLALDDTNGAIEQNKNTLNGLNKEYDTTVQYSEKLFTQAEIQQKIANLTQLASDGGVEIPKALAEGMTNGQYAIPESISQLEALIKFDEALNNANLAGTDIPLKISEGLINGTTSVEGAIEQVNSVIEFNKGLEKASADGVAIPQNLSENMMNGKISVDEANAQLNDAIKFDKAIEEANTQGIAIPTQVSTNIKNGKLSVEDANTQMNNWVEFSKALETSKLAGQNIPIELQTAILEGKYKPVEALDVLNNELKEEADSLQPVMKESSKTTGEFYLDGLLIGFRNPTRRTDIKVTSKGIGEEALDALNKSLKENSPSKATEESGKYFLDGLRIGIDNRDKRNGIFASIASFGASLLARLKAALSEQSPSKATKEMGVYLLEGLSIGIAKEENPVLKQVEKFGRSVVDTLNNELDESIGMQTMVDNVRSSISRAKTSMSNMQIPTLNSVASIPNSASNTTSNVNNFTQIINAPKQPSRIELYRQTKNLMNLKLKGGN